MDDNLRPLLRDTVQVFNRNDKFLFLEPDIPDWLVVNSKYCPIIHMMDGNHSLQSIKSYIKNEYSDEADLLEKQITNFVSTSLLISNNQNQKNKRTFSQVRYVYLTLTDRCNLHCTYCYAKQRKPGKELSINQWIAITDNFIDTFKDITFTVTGGEPLIVKDIFKLATHIKNRDCNTVLITNGQLLQNEDYAKEASNLFSEIRISIDSIEEKINSDLRGKKSLEKALAGYQNCCRNGKNPIVMCVVSRANMKHLKSMINYFGNNCVFQPLFKMGNAENHTELAISGVEYFRALKDASAPICMPGLYNNIHSYRGHPYKRCALAIEELSVGPDGTIFPCHMMHYDELQVGNALNGNIEQIYNNSKILKELRLLNVDTIDQCKKCEVRNFCGTGCRARIGNKGIKKEEGDSFCSFEKESILDALFCSFD
jgi:radical SAM protein with 4Fe4S-binding SPASM domain